MTETDLSDWLPLLGAAMAIRCSRRTVERLARAGKLEQRLRPQKGSPPVVVYNPDDVARLAAERQPAAPPFVLPAMPAGNGNGHAREASSAGMRALRNPDGAYSGEDLIRGLALLISKALQSPPSPPVAESHVGETLYLDVEQAAAYLHWTTRDLRAAIRDREVPCRKPNQREWRTWRIRRKDLEAL